MAISNPNKYINSDLNVRLPYVSPQDSVVIVDKEAVLQSIYRLFNTEVGEIPNYRGYGLNLKQFLQRPMGQSLAKEINDYVKGRIELYEQRVEVIKANVNANYYNSSISLQYYVRIKTTDEIVGLEPLVIPIG